MFFKKSACFIVCLAIGFPVFYVNAHNRVGIRNIGNSCYLNSVLQQFYALPKLKSSVCSNTSPDKPFSTKLRNIFQIMDSSQSGHVNLFREIKGLGSEVYDGIQKDASEVFYIIANKFKDEIGENTFNIEYRTQITCPNCKSQAVKRETDIALNLPVSANLDASLKEFCQESKIPDYKCSVCKQKDSSRRLEITSYPQTLVCILKRFKKTGKINVRMEFEECLNFDTTRYRLSGVLCHSGGCGGGHYFSYVYSKENQKWYLINDSRVFEKGDFDNIKEDCFGNGRSPSNAYMLFYDKIS